MCLGCSINTRSHFQAELIKECMLTFFEKKRYVVAAIQRIPLSTRSNSRKNKILAANNKSSFFEILQKAPCYTVAVDESCDVVNEKEMFNFVLFLDIESKSLREELLGVLPFRGKTRVKIYSILLMTS